jgi:hypothetical protein
VSTPPQMMDVLYMQTFLQVLGIFTRNAELIESSASAFLANGFRLCMPVYSTMSISSTSSAGAITTLTVQVQQGDFPTSTPAAPTAVLLQNASGTTIGATSLTSATPTTASTGSLAYTTATIAGAVAAGDIVIVLNPIIIDFVIPASLIGLLQTNFSLFALTQPSGCYVTPSTGTPTGVLEFSSTLPNPVIVSVGPLTITPPMSANGNLQILYQDQGSGAITQPPPLQISTPGSPITITPTSLSGGKSYRAIVFVPDCPIAVSGVFPG